MRIFIALDIDQPIRERIERFLEGVRGFAPDARWVRPESLHITLKFIGEKRPESVGLIKSSLAKIQVGAMEIAFQGFGFFPTAKSARVFWVGIQAGPELGRLATAVDDALLSLGIPKEEHAFSPHLTLARGGKSGAPRRPSDRPNVKFDRLQEKLAAMPQPEFGTMTAREFFLYESKLSRDGSQYTKLDTFPLQ
ncbi:MAG TPA: RNA 2',3'-cyclic phosphodiesterase [Terriglobales bacterium]|nr:RNA 2',3'-cyclic phosphodiesterase [Terriglobales bacterium]